MAPRYTTAKDGGSAIFAGAKNCTVHPEHTRSLPSMAPRYTVHPEHTRSLPSMAPRYTVHPEHTRSLPSMAPRYTVHPEHNNQYTFTRCWFFYHSISQLFILLNQASCF